MRKKVAITMAVAIIVLTAGVIILRGNKVLPKSRTFSFDP